MSSQIDDNISLKAPPAAPLVLGYPTLAAYIGATSELTIFRRFTSLQTQTLLYYQAELVYLEAQLRGLEVEASNTEDSDPRSRRSEPAHESRASHPCCRQRIQYVKILKPQAQ
jgi:hypothetical protein